MQIYLPIAEISVQIYWIILVGMFSGFMTGLFGIGGNFITIPTLIFMGVPPTVALSSAVNQTISSSFSGFLGHWKRNNVDIAIGLYLSSGGFFGAIIGSLAFKFLKSVGYMDVIIFLIYIVMLGTISIILSIESFQKIFLKKNTEKNHHKDKNKKRSIFNMLPMKRKFETADEEISIIAILLSGTFVGFLVAISGVGGGFILVPMLIYAFKIKTTVAIGTSVLQSVLVTTIITFLHATTTKTVDVLLALLLVVGALFGVNMGIRLSTKLKPEALRGLLAIVVLFGFFRLIFALFITPTSLYSFAIVK